ncbi:MAG: hypothetical protein AAF721_25515 [Myxococcota bacterium]
MTNVAFTARTWLLASAGLGSLALIGYGFALVSGPDSSEQVADGSASSPTDKAAVPARRRSRLGPRSSGSRPTFAPRPEEHSDAAQMEEPAPIEQQVAEALRHATAEENEFVASFEAESTDGDFASRWEPRLTATLEHALGASAGFNDITIECHAQRCLGEARWASYADATRAIESAADATHGECATFVFMPPPDDPRGPYAHKVRFTSCQPSPS